VFNYPAGIALQGSVDGDYSTIEFRTINGAMVIPLIPNFDPKNDIYVTSFQYNTWIANVTGLRNAEGQRIAETFGRRTYDYATPLFGVEILMVLPIEMTEQSWSFGTQTAGVEVYLDGPINVQVSTTSGSRGRTSNGSFKEGNFGVDQFPLTNNAEKEVHANYFLMNVGGMSYYDLTHIDAMPWALKIPRRNVLVYVLWINTCFYDPSRNVITKQENYVFAAVMMTFLSVYRHYNSDSSEPNILVDNSGMEPECRNKLYCFPSNKYCETTKAINIIVPEVTVQGGSNGSV